MITVWKYELNTNNNIVLEIPLGAELLDIQMQGNIPCIWVKVNTTEPLIHRTFRIVGTGHELPNTEIDYCGTFQMSDGMLIFHLFEL